MRRIVRVGTRGSLLARRQTQWVVDQLSPWVAVEVVEIRTKGDEILETPLYRVGDKGLFTKELDLALLKGDIDLAVHSMKDLPTTLPEGLCIGAVPEREDPRDVWIGREDMAFSQIPQGAVVATGSLRRRAQLKALRPDLRLENLRGNVDTRLRKLSESDWAGIVLAGCGLRRAGYEDRIHEWLSTEQMLPAAGQGALALVCREEDGPMRHLLAHLNHRNSEREVVAERAFLATLEGGCQVPLGALARVSGGKLVLEGFLSDLEGRELLREKVEAPLETPSEEVGKRLADSLLARGGREILRRVREQLSQGSD